MNTWIYAAPSTFVFNNTAKAQVLTIHDNGAGEFTVNLTKSGVDKGTISLDTIADIKDMFSQVAGEL